MRNIRKNFFKFLLVSSFIGLSGCQLTEKNSKDTATSNQNPQHFLIGSYTQEGSEGVYKVALDTTSNTFINKGSIATGINPSYLALTQNQQWLFAATGKKQGGITSYQWSDVANKFILSQKIDGLGKGTCHISLNPQENQIAIANYSSSDVHLFNINPTTKALTKAGYFKNAGNGPTSRQEKSHMHYVQWDNAGSFLYAVDLGTDEVLAFNSQNKNFTPTIAAKLAAGDGPRHLTFHPSKPLVYVLNELSNSLAVFEQNALTGTLALKQQVSVLVKPSQNNTSSAIKISKDGKFVYVGVRGINEIAVFAINNDGMAELLQSHSTLGDWPRDISLSHSGDHLLIANQKSSTLTVLKRDSKTGLLSDTDLSLNISTPSYIGLLK